MMGEEMDDGTAVREVRDGTWGEVDHGDRCRLAMDDIRVALGTDAPYEDVSAIVRELVDDFAVLSHRSELSVACAKVMRRVYAMDSLDAIYRVLGYIDAQEEDR